MRNIVHTHTVPSLSGTFGIRTRLARNPKMPKEPSSLSHSYTRTERQCVENKTNRFENNNGQRTLYKLRPFGLRLYRR